LRINYLIDYKIMEENNTTNQSKISQYINNNEYLAWCQNKSPYTLIGMLILVIVTPVLIIAFVFYLKSSGIDFFNKKDQLDNQQLNLSTDEKENILKSLSSDSTHTNIPNDEKHKELDKLTGQPENNIQLREFEKVDILKRLSQ